MLINKRLFFIFIFSFLIIEAGYSEYQEKVKTEEDVLKRNGFLYYFDSEKKEKKFDLKKPKLAIIIDDAGYSFKEAKNFFELDANITYAILPFTPYAKKIAKYAHKKGLTIVGDIPIFVAHDSADVWAQPELSV